MPRKRPSASRPSAHGATRLQASQLGLHDSMVSTAVLEVIDGLMRAGFKAYIIGGGVRDLLLGMRPKDFDVVTDATPAQIRDVFGKRCRIIGRRFELAHVYSGRDMIEVATFRAPPRKNATSATGMITRDNVWGTIEQDYVRRDYTINTLYYQPREDLILDFCHAIDDIEARELKLQGVPLVRFEEDPVRMLRGLRFAAKLEFEIDPAITRIMTPELTLSLLEVSPHRIYDETQKMFSGGHLAPLLPLMIQHHVWERLFVDAPAKITPLIQKAAENTDARIAIGKSINPAFFYAVLLWEPFLARVEQLKASGSPHSIAWTQAGLDVLRRQAKHTAIPRFSELFIREIWEMQPRLEHPRPRQIPLLAAHARFRAAYDFLHMRQDVGDATVGTMGQWWHDYQLIGNDARERAIADINRLQQRQQKNRPEGAALEPLMAVIHDADLAAAPTSTAEVPAAKPKRTRQKASSAEHLAQLEEELQTTAIFDQATEGSAGRRKRAPRAAPSEPLATNQRRKAKPQPDQARDSTVIIADATEQEESLQLLPADDPAMKHVNLRAKYRKTHPLHPGSGHDDDGSDTAPRARVAPRSRQPRSKPLQIAPTIVRSDDIDAETA